MVLPIRERISATYHFVLDEVLFGYHRDDAIPADEVLKDRYGQCNTKTILFMALLGGAGIACRPHGFTIDKKLQKGARTEKDYLLSPEESVHNWAQFFEGEWGDAELGTKPISARYKSAWPHIRATSADTESRMESRFRPQAHFEKTTVFIYRTAV